MTSPASASTRPVQEQVEALLAHVGKQQRRVAEYILANPSMILFATATDVAQRAGADPATVVRFVQRLGFAGYTEFRERLRSEHPSLCPPIEHVMGAEPETGASEIGVTVATVRTQTLANLERTFEDLDARTLDGVLDALLAARRVVVIGAGVSHILALHLHRMLQTAQVTTHLMADWYDLLFAAASLSARDLLFGIASLRYSKVTIEALRLARAAGASTVLLTDAMFAPGADIADRTLLFAPRAAGEFASPAAGSAVIDCLAAGLRARVPERVEQGLRSHVDLASAHGLNYW